MSHRPRREASQRKWTASEVGNGEDSNTEEFVASADEDEQSYEQPWDEDEEAMPDFPTQAEAPCALDDEVQQPSNTTEPSPWAHLSAKERKEKEEEAELQNWEFTWTTASISNQQANARNRVPLVQGWYEKKGNFNKNDTGPKGVPEKSSPLDIFQLLWRTILPKFVQVLNDTLERIVHKPDPNDPDGIPIPTSEANRAHPVTPEIVLAWIGIWMYQCVSFRPDLRSYWEAHSDEPSWVKSVGGLFTSYWQWILMFRALFHLPTEFLDWMEEELNEVFPSFWTCGPALCIDEIMKKFKGRSSHKVFEPSKPARFGLKYYALVDSSGYLFQFQQHRKGTHVVLKDLCVKFLSRVDQDNGKRLFCCDNYYGSLALAEWCQVNQLDFVMTMRSNRPTFLWSHLRTNTKIVQGLGSTAQATNKKTNISVLAWKDKSDKHTLFVTNLSQRRKIDTVQVTRNSNRKKVVKEIPVIASVYTHLGMGHVDSFGQLLVSVGPSRKNKSWKRCSFICMLQITLANCIAIDKQINKPTKQTKRAQKEGANKWQTRVAKMFVQPYKDAEKAKKKAPPAASRQLRYYHRNKATINAKKRRMEPTYHQAEFPTPERPMVEAIPVEISEEELVALAKRPRVQRQLTWVDCSNNTFK